MSDSDQTEANCDALSEIIKKIAVREDALRTMKEVRDILMEIPEVKKRRQEHIAKILDANPQALAEAIAKSASKKKSAEPVRIIYTNHKGRTAERKIVPDGLWFGLTEYHPEPQWLLEAWDLDKHAIRNFAMKDIRLWELEGDKLPEGLCRRCGRLRKDLEIFPWGEATMDPKPVPLCESCRERTMEKMGVRRGETR